VGQPRHANFGVAHGRRRVAVDGTEIALPVDHRVAQGEILRHANDGVVNGAVAVGVIFTDDVADDPGRLLVGLVPVVLEFVHGVQYATVHRLEAVAYIGQRTADDDAHGVIQIGFFHLRVDADR
jgi:hypothetical protein